jgi:hypothetical protein
MSTNQAFPFRYYNYLKNAVSRYKRAKLEEEADIRAQFMMVLEQDFAVTCNLMKNFTLLQREQPQ